MENKKPRVQWAYNLLPTRSTDAFSKVQASSMTSVRHHETGEKSKESKTDKLGRIDDVIIEKATVSWADVVRRSVYDQRDPVSSAGATHRLLKL